MATKQAKSNADAIKERPHATLPTFGVPDSGDPWRAAPAFAAMAKTWSADPGKPFGDRSAAYTDRFGTAGPTGEADYGKPERADAAQKPEAAQKGASTGDYRVPISGVVQ